MTSTPLSKGEIDPHMRDLAHGIAHQELESLHVQPATIEDVNHMAHPVRA